MVLRLKDSKDLKWEKIRSHNGVSCIQNILIKSNILKDMEQLFKNPRPKERGIQPRALELTLSSGQAIDE